MSRLQGLLVIAVVALVGMVTVRVVLSRRTPEQKLADRWLAAVRSGDEKTALEIANKLVPDGHGQVAHPAYKDVFAHEKLPASFLTGTFNSHDFRAWSDAAFFHDLAYGKTVKQLFDLVTNRIQPVEPKSMNAWPREIWERRFGLCDRMCWVMAELAYQQGSDACMVYLRDKDRSSPHTVVEVRSAQMVWMVDPLMGLIGHGRSVERVAYDPKAVGQFWPKNKVWQECLKNSFLYTPSSPGDYCWRNQQLHRVLAKLLMEGCPRFGEDPRTRQLRVAEMRKRELGNGTRFPMTVWNHPLRLLYRDMLQSGEIKAASDKKQAPKGGTPGSEPAATAPAEPN